MEEKKVDLTKKFERSTELDEKLKFDTTSIEDIKNIIDNGYPFLIIVDDGVKTTINSRGLSDMLLSSLLSVYSDKFNFNKMEENCKTFRIIKMLLDERAENNFLSNKDLCKH